MIAKKSVIKFLSYLVGLFLVYFLLLMALPKEYPYSILPPIVLGMVVGIISPNWRRLIILSILPIILSLSYLILILPNTYTINKVLSTGVVLILPYFYHVTISASFSAMIYSFRNIYFGDRHEIK